jgi:hypothetical protein
MAVSNLQMKNSMKKKYEWKLKSLAKGINPTDAVRELARIEKTYGALTAENVLEASKPKKAAFNSLFIWDDSEAARRYRLDQARWILNNVQVVIISDGQPRQIGAYEIVKVNDARVYKNVKDFTPSEVEQVKVATIRDLNILRSKLSVYNVFNQVVGKLDEALSLFENSTAGVSG